MKLLRLAFVAGLVIAYLHGETIEIQPPSSNVIDPTPPSNILQQQEWRSFLNQTTGRWEHGR